MLTQINTANNGSRYTLTASVINMRLDIIRLPCGVINKRLEHTPHFMRGVLIGGEK